MSKRTRITRRALFRGIGTTTLIASCSTPKAPPPEAPPESINKPIAGAIGPGKAPLSFQLNGAQTTVDVAPSETLLDTLRLTLDKTGTKKVCDRGSCGACMVLVDGVPQNSCMTLAHDIAGREVTTVEGLSDAPGDDLVDGPGATKLSALQRAFVEHDALQCGFCTSGMLISCSALLRRAPEAARDEHAIREAISGNLCRCGTYPHVVAAVQSVAGGAPKGPMKGGA